MERSRFKPLAWEKCRKKMSVSSALWDCCIILFSSYFLSFGNRDKKGWATAECWTNLGGVSVPFVRSQVFQTEFLWHTLARKYKSIMFWGFSRLKESYCRWPRVLNWAHCSCRVSLWLLKFLPCSVRWLAVVPVEPRYRANSAPPIKHTINCPPRCHSQRPADGTAASSPLFPPSWLFSPLLRHRDATADRIMHFSWGAKRERTGCSSSVWAMFCSVNT